MDTPLIAQMGLIDWTAIGVFIKDVGGYFIISALAVWVSLKLIRLNDEQAKRASDAQDRAIAVQESLAKAIVVVTHTGEQLSAQADQHRERIDRLEGLITALAELVEISNRKQGEYNLATRAEYRANWDAAIAQMKGAGDRFDKRLDETVKVTSDAISGVKSTLTEHRADQTKDLQMAVDDLKRQIEQNGDATRAKLEPILAKLNDISATLATLNKDMQHLSSQSDARATDADEQRKIIADIAGKMNSVVSDVASLTHDFAASAHAPVVPPVAAAPADVQQTVAPDPLAVTTKHATGTLPALPSDAPDAKRDTEAT